MTSFASTAADANSTKILVAEETTFDTAPSGTYETLRITGESLGADTETAQSQELRTDRAVGKIKRINRTAGGDLAVELSVGGILEDLLEAGIASSGFASAGTPLNDTSISATAAVSGVCAIGDTNSGFDQAVGSWVSVAGFANAENNGIFKVVGSTASVLSVANPNAVVETAGESVTITQLAQATANTDPATFRSFTFEKDATDLSTNEYELLTGHAVNTINFDIPTSGIVTGSIGMAGSKSTIADSAAGSGSNAATTSPVMDSIDNIVACYIKYGGVWYVQPLTNFSFNTNQNLRARQQVGTLGAISMGFGQFQAAGTVQAFLENKALLGEYLSFNDVQIALVTVDDDGNGYIFDFPLVKFTAGRVVAQGINTDVIVDLSFEASINETESTMFRIAKY